MPIPQAIKQVAFKLFPDAAETWQRSHQERHQARFEESLGLPRISEAFVEKHGLVVRSGPFNGMRYIPAATGSMFIPKLLGSYEMELHERLEQLIGRNPATVVDIGCAEGYYAVGLASRLPHAKIIAFDSNPKAKEMCQQLARENGLENHIDIRGTCEASTFETILGESKKNGQVSALVICDCDGCEAFVLDPIKVPSLTLSDILVETHDYLDNTLTATLKQNFALSHNIEWIPSGSRDPQNHPDVHFLSPDDQAKAVNEYRPPQGWLIMTPKDRSLSN